MIGIGIVAKAAAVTAGSVGLGGLAVVGVAQADEAGSGLRERICAADPAEVAARRDARQADYVADVAVELGIEASELEAAMRDVALDHLDERLADAVASGHLTQAEADELRAAAEAGDLRDLLAERHPQVGMTRLERIQDRAC